MKKDPHRDPLDELLRRWAARHAPAEADAEPLRHRIGQALRDDAFLDLPPAAPPRRRAWAWALGFALGAAVTLAVLVTLHTREGQHPHGTVAGSPANGVPASNTATSNRSASDLPQSVFIGQSELAEKAKLLAGMQELFAGRLAWVGEAGREVQVGLLPDAVSGGRESRPLTVRVVVLARTNGDSAWRPIWQADVIAQNDELVDLPAESTRDGSLQLWMHALPNGAIAVNANLALKGAACVRSAFSGIQQTGVPQRVFDSQTDGTEYQVYQTVAPLQVKSSS